MLSIQPLSSAEGSASYYLDAVNYYQNDSQSIRWLGAGAKALGIHGQTVEKEQMMALLSGVLPDGTQLGRIDKDGVHHRPGFDMTVSAPKSFSILLESGAAPELAKVLDEAVEWFVEEMEKEFAQTRQVIDGKIEYVDTGNFTIASFRHPNSRANDPLSHVHLVGLNMTQCPDGKWRSLASDMEGKKGVVEQIMKYHIYGGLKFRNKLANLTKNAGFKLTSNGDGFWEIQGVPEQVMTHYSKRRKDIEAYKEEKGWSGAKASSIAAQRTKMEKEIIDFDQWKQDIVTECNEMGFCPNTLAEAARNQQKNRFQSIKEQVVELFYGKNALELRHARESVFVAIESVSQQQAVFDVKTLKQEALKYVIAGDKVVDERQIDKAIEENITSKNLYKAMHPYTRQPLLTTPWQLTLESEAIERIENGKEAIAAICSRQTVTNFIKEKEQELQFALSPSQKRAMTTFLTTKDRFIAIQGYAGTGKTTMLRLTRELASLHGYEIRGITAGSAAANELRTKGGLNASTFAKELGRLQKQKYDLSKTIFVVDEASMLSNPQGHKIIKIADQYNTQIKIIGDKAQLPTPSSGKFFSLTQDYGIQTVSMTDNLRQKDPKLKESAIHASHGEIYDAVQKLSRVEELGTYQERTEHMARKWLSLSKDERENTLCFAPTHKNRRDITEIIRSELEKEGTLTGNVHHQEILKERNLTSIKTRRAVYYSKNDVIRFNNTISRHDIKAGDYLSVGEVTPKHKGNDTLPLIRSNGQTITFKLSALPKFRTENKDLERPIEIYRKEVLPLMAGDRILFKRNFEAQGIRNAELGTLEAITSEGIEIKTDENISVKLAHNAKELKHLDHGYVLTTYAAQGKDKKRGLGLIEASNRFATTIQNYYVETTRGINEMIVVTEDKEQLIKAITTNDSDKPSSMEMIDSDTMKIHEKRFHENKHSISIQNTIEKKLSKEQDWRVLENTVENYVQAKQHGKSQHAAKLAFVIVQDPKLYRLSKERLGFKSGTYRRDALTYETSRLFHSLPPAERKLFSIVRQYVNLNQQIASRIAHEKQIPGLLVKADTKRNQVPDINTHKKETEFANVSNNLNLNKKRISDLTVKRNNIALEISSDLEAYKPYLKHYSIGELNRIGLPQHEYMPANKKAQTKLETLAKYAAFGQIRTNITSYLKANGEDREALAVQIRREAKLSHRFVIEQAKTLNQEPANLWKNINQDARQHSDRLFRNGLNSEGKLAFDTVKAYKALQMEIRESWSDGLKEQEGTVEIKNSFNTKTLELFRLRNDIASSLLQIRALPDVCSYFKLDITKLKQQNQKHEYRNNVSSFVANQSNFKARMDSVNAIKNDIRGHYSFIKEAGIDTSVISKYLRVTDRMEHIKNLPDAGQNDYKKFLAYKNAGRQAYHQWQQVHEQKNTAKKHNVALIEKAVLQSSTRDKLAFDLKDSLYLDTILSYEKGDKDKLNNQANTHRLKLRELKELGEAIHTLTNQFPSIESKEKTAISAWKSDWSMLCKHVEQVEKKTGYKLALEDYPLNSAPLKTINIELRERYQTVSENPQFNPEKSVNKTLQKIQKSANHLDARVVNEVLMENPEISYKAIFGEPKSHNPKEMRYSGGLIVTLKGKDKGLWHDFSSGTGGAPIQAIMETNGIGFKEALNEAEIIAGIDSKEGLFQVTNHLIRDNKTASVSREMEKKNKIISARSIWDGAINAKGTMAEKYLSQHRGIDNIDKLDIRFWPVNSKWKNYNDKGILEDKLNKIPAVIYPFNLKVLDLLAENYH
ncbi:TPA: conjugative transfer relaxase/helicase TraI [Legionella pneumophila]|nr:conjugative transfer relaxase/helicase TraI [Legionella pneumophila]HBD7410343.1 conjugative transfer relaxase/helicase TraI [Legionella pneumophila]HBD9405536.1 conjugative transfer relaxase/helicase TraI [Legionella pneumophila]HBI2968765.1 conjugative transfer relaxase/helicase TraI [Legionella pneumophila]